MHDPPDPSYTPQNIISGVKGLLVGLGAILGAVLTFSSRRDASKNQALTIGLAERRESLEERVAARVAAEAEIARKDTEIAWWRRDSVEGWTGLNNAVLRWTQDNHVSANNEQGLVGTIERASKALRGVQDARKSGMGEAQLIEAIENVISMLEVPKLRERSDVPSAQVLAGRKE